MASSSPSKRQVYDGIRKLWVSATPEEIVRQTFLCRMVQQLGYPKELIAVEKGLKEISPENSPVPDRRIDLVCFAKGDRGALFPLLLIECKEGRLDQKAISQVVGYNFFVKAPFVAVVNLKEVLLGCFERKEQRYLFQRELPSYSALLRNNV